LSISLFAVIFTSSISLSSFLAFADNDQTNANGPPFERVAHPPIHVKKFTNQVISGLSPTQIRTAYGLNSLGCSMGNSITSWNDPTLCGHGQVIAIVDAFDDPNIASDLQTFSTAQNLPSCPAGTCFVKITPPSTRTNSGWALEEALDVEWAHAIAPGAKIVLVEGKTNSFSNLFGAVDTASSYSGVHQVSMSWGGSEFSSEVNYDSHFQKSGVSFFASSGDSGSGTIYPSTSPYVVSVGGTTLNVDSAGNVLSETAWSGSGGGVSTVEPKPSYQSSFSYIKRSNPDVSYNADPSTGVPVYDSVSYNGQSGWFQVGGTSAGSPQWAAITAIINQNRTSPLSSMSFGTETSLYNAATLSSTNYRDIISGSNGNQAGTGYDLVTGYGSPLANNLVPYVRSH